MCNSLLLLAILIALSASGTAQRLTLADVLKLDRQQYTEWLKQLDEPILSDHPVNASAETYRLVFAEALRIDGPMVVRVVVNRDGSSEIYSKWLVERKTLMSKRYHLPPDQTAKLLRGVEQSGFWNREQGPLERAIDGSSWRFEALRNGEYHVLEEWNPKHRDWIRVVGDQMLSIAHARIRPRD
jgi:hypothetical protein